MPKATLIVFVSIVLIVSGGWVHGQLASEYKSADECLESALLTLDEVSLAYCCRFHGTWSSVNRTRDELYFANVYCYAAQSRGAGGGEFHSYGEQPVSLEDDAVVRRIDWAEALRVGQKSLFRFGRDIDDRVFPRVQHREEGKPWGHPEIDPLGVLLCVESSLLRRGSQIELMIPLYAALSPGTSKLLKNGCVEGTWRKGKGHRVIEFDPKQGHMPTRIRFWVWDEEKEKPGDLIFEHVIVWKAVRGPDMKVSYRYPAKFSSISHSPPQERVDTSVELTFEWAADIDESSFDFEKLIASPPNSLRRHFDAWFEDAEMKK